MVRPAANLDKATKPLFYAGKALAGQPWVRAPTQTDARDGLGPLYNARSCLACHLQGGRGQTAPEAGGPLFATLVRLSLPGQGPHGEPIPEPTYGTQLQPQSTALSHQVRGHQSTPRSDHEPPAEGDVWLHWLAVPMTYPDGQDLTLRQPALELREFGYGPLHADTLIGLRHPPALAGVGLLDLIAQADIDRLADPDDHDANGISGRVNMVWDPETQTLRPGRFGLKANQPTVRVQVAAALQGDMGLSNPVFPQQPCTDRQTRCLHTPTGNDTNGHEVGEDLLRLMVLFNRSIGVPERRKPNHPKVVQGRELFFKVGCSDCHKPHFVTDNDPNAPHLSHQDIWPYTDLLLHDMGPDLSDGRPDSLATGSEWRTAPLWGVGLARAMQKNVGLLHDGRARNVEEAILWHGGEARSSRNRFITLSREQRSSLIAFVRSL